MRRILGFLKKYPIVVTFAITVGAFSYALNEVNEVATLARATAEQREIDSILGGRANCEAINTSTDKLRAVVFVATSGTTGIDYTAIPEFEPLHQNTKSFLIALRARSAEVGNLKAREEFLKGLDLRNCVAEYPLPKPK